MEFIMELERFVAGKSNRVKKISSGLVRTKFVLPLMDQLVYFQLLEHTEAGNGPVV